jgi:hypothetical protein
MTNTKAASGIRTSGTRGRPAQVAAAPADTLAASGKTKPKLVRDSFTIPKAEYAVLDALKLRAANLMRPTKKSELLRAGINVLQAMNDKAFLSAVRGIPSLKTGRPKAADKIAAKATVIGARKLAVEGTASKAAKKSSRVTAKP